MHTIGEIYYGSYWRIAKDEREKAVEVIRGAINGGADLDMFDLLDELDRQYKGAHVALHGNGELTLIFGRRITTVTEADNDFHEMDLIRIMNLQQGNLRDDIRKDVREIIENVPVGLREELSSPKFCIAWSTV